MRALARSLSPAHRKWKRLLQGLTLDPDELDPPVKAPGERDFIICGASRTGTSLVSAMLFQPPKILTVLEPWDGMRLPPSELFRSLRKEIDTTATLRRGRFDPDALSGDMSLRWVREGKRPIHVSMQAGYRLGVKWPAFWRYLEVLPRTRFIVCLRHPLEVIASFSRTGGRLRRGLDYDIAFNAKMNRDLQAATKDDSLRRVLLYDYVNSRVLPHLSRPNVFPLRYERWFSEPKRVLDELGSFLGIDVSASKVAIRPPAAKADLPEPELALIRERCVTAEALGYAL
jgi:hypothetical protein